MKRFVALVVCIAIAAFGSPVRAQTTIVLPTAKDNTIYDLQNGEYLSNGAGQHMFAGVTSGNNTRRALLAFDLSSIPPGSTITNVTLRLNMSRSRANGDPSSLHKLLANWGEGTSNASGAEGGGATPTTNDATWIHRSFNTQLWTTAGADYSPTPSATLTISGQNGFKTWSGGSLVADVQAWLNNPATNFGWILRGNETETQTAMRFDSREHPTTALRPQLTVTYSSPAPTGACCIGDMCEVLTAAQCTSQGGMYSGDNTSCTPNPCSSVGACCLPNGSCTEVTESECMAQQGTYQGNATMCSMASCPIVLTPFVDALPLPGIAQPVAGVPGGAAHYDIEILEVQQQLHRDLPPSRVWGYDGSYPGPTIEARTDAPVTVVWRNNLRVLETQQPRITHVLPVDTCLHGPDMTGETPVTVTHLHGGHVPADSDGYPEDTFGPGGQSPLYTYPNNQHASTIWYHDHALGITRLNVYMGLAGFYLIRDAQEDALNLPRGEYEIPLAIQDRSFNPDGSLKYPSMWMDHFFGDFIVVNGKVWPYLNVSRGKYRFRLLNGSTSRSYRLSLSNGATFSQIGTDLGLMPAPIAITQLTITPGERADIVIDFASYAPGTEIILTNDAPAPFPSGDPALAIPNVMKFIVQAATGDTDALPSTLAPFEAISESEAVIERPFELRRGAVTSECPSHEGGMWMINDLMWDDITEFPRIGSTEIWSWINRSGSTHPMHMHLVGVQVLDRQNFEIVNGVVVPFGPKFPPAANEIGWKDTVQATPNQITRVITRFEDYVGLFPYHCHILEHEDHEMMRQFEVLCDAPSIDTPPTSVSACNGGSTSFSVTASGDIPTYEWRFEGTPIQDGIHPNGAVFSGSTTATLLISGLTFADVGAYSCVVNNPCGTATSHVAQLTICAGDADCDFDTDSDDVILFFAAWDNGDLLADVDNDSDTDSDDVIVFFSSWDTGC